MKKIYTKIIGFLANINFPPYILEKAISLYSKIYNVNLQEIEKPIFSFTTFNKFFTRSLKKELRPIDNQPDIIVSPVDATVTEFGKMKKETMIQAKGLHFTLSDLLIQDSLVKNFTNGNYCVLYLSPKNYHCIHSPDTGNVSQAIYYPGKLRSVNASAVNKIPNLFSENERTTTILETPKGPIAIVKVAATAVSKIPVAYLSSQEELYKIPSTKSKFNQLIFNSPKPFHKGELLAKFELGSTVILLLPPNITQLTKLIPYQTINMGEAIANWIGKK